MNWDRVHSGQYRQGAIAPDEIEAQQAAGLVPGINPDLRVPVIDNPGDGAELNLHGDVAGSPYSTTPGEISLGEAGKQARGDDKSNPAADAADTRTREVESRRTGVSTQSLAADEDAGDDKKPSKPPAHAATAKK